MLHRPTSLLLVLLLAGCTATKASIQIVNADDSLRSAREYDADQQAIYEYTMAMRYLEKAKEEAGHSDWRIADALARQSAEWSDRAIIFTQKRGRSEMNLDDFSDQARPAPSSEPQAAPAPAPSIPDGLEDILGPTQPPPAPAPAPAPTTDLDDLLSEPTPAPAPAEPAPAPAPSTDDLDDLLSEPLPGEEPAPAPAPAPDDGDQP